MITLNLGHPSKDELKTSDDLSFDLAADNHLDAFVDDVVDFHDRGLRTNNGHVGHYLHNHPRKIS